MSKFVPKLNEVIEDCWASNYVPLSEKIVTLASGGDDMINAGLGIVCNDIAGNTCLARIDSALDEDGISLVSDMVGKGVIAAMTNEVVPKLCDVVQPVFAQ